MDRVVNAGRNLVEYCFGNRVALKIVQFQRNLEKIRGAGQEIWTMPDKAGIVFKDNRWYVWVKKYIGNANFEGLIYENVTVKNVLDTVHTAIPWLSADERMNIVRQFRHANHLA